MWEILAAILAGESLASAGQLLLQCASQSLICRNLTYAMSQLPNGRRGRSRFLQSLRKAYAGHLS